MRVDLKGFEEMYRRDEDPWDFVSSPYEQRKYDVTIASLPRRDYRRCFEPGCSIGALTERLARVADEVVAMDAAPTAIDVASRRLSDVEGVSASVGTLPEQWPAGEFDLIVFSEIGYYWDEVSWADIVSMAASRLAEGGHLLGVHWIGHSLDHVLNGRIVHQVMRALLGEPVVEHRDQQFVLDVWQPS